MTIVFKLKHLGKIISFELFIMVPCCISLLK